MLVLLSYSSRFESLNHRIVFCFDTGIYWNRIGIACCLYIYIRTYVEIGREDLHIYFEDAVLPTLYEPLGFCELFGVNVSVDVNVNS